jgi:hypothetical protein
MPIDVVIPLGPKDEEFINTVIIAARQNVRELRTIFVVAHRPMDISGATVIPEQTFPFQASNIAALGIPPQRVGWYLQQLLKLYAPLVIPGILPNVLLLDADTVLFRSLRFFQGDKALLDFNRETHGPYFQHMRRLNPSFEPWLPRTSGIVNLMPVTRQILEELFSKVEAHHQKPFWQAFLECVDPAQASGASEYEIYFHYVMRNHPSKAKIRHLQYDNFGFRTNIQANGYDYVTYHWHHQTKR